MKGFGILIIFILCIGTLQAQNTKRDSLQQDSTKASRAKHQKIYSGPRKASIFSAVLPGLGQVYNRKYWKVPIVYAALGSMVYIFKTNNDQYNFYRNNLLRLVKDTSLTSIGGLNQSQLQTEKLAYKKNRDFAVLGIVGIYILNIIDANVDAHLKTFDVSDDLSLTWDPCLIRPVYGYKNCSVALRLTFNFKK